MWAILEGEIGFTIRTNIVSWFGGTRYCDIPIPVFVHVSSKAGKLQQSISYGVSCVWNLLYRIN